MKEARVAPFRFKQFDVSHYRSSMKVGVDAVLLGALGAVEGGTGLEIGCGCGVIALMAAQRNGGAYITAIDIHAPSVEECNANFAKSPWGDRLRAKLYDALDFAGNNGNAALFDFIIANPPYFNAGVKEPCSPREQARHEGRLTLDRLTSISGEMLVTEGKLSVIIPYDRRDEMKSNPDLFLIKEFIIANKPDSQPKRAVLIFGKKKPDRCETFRLNIRDEKGNYSEEYRRLTAPFYLHEL